MNLLNLREVSVRIKSVWQHRHFMRLRQRHGGTVARTKQEKELIADYGLDRENFWYAQ